MSKNPIYLALIFFLELANLVALGVWGWTQHDGFLRWLLMLGLPTIAAAIWGIFRVPGEPNDAPVPVSGRVRLLIEWAFFASGVYLLADAHYDRSAMIMGLVVVGSYLISYDRTLRFLLERDIPKDNNYQKGKL